LTTGNQQRLTGSNPTAEQLKELQNLIDKGAGIREVMRHFRRGHRIIARWLALADRSLPASGTRIARSVGAKQELLDRMKILHEDGYSCREIAAMDGFPEQGTVYRWLRAACIDTTARTAPTPRQMELLTRLHAEGKSFVEIMRAVGNTSRMVSVWMRELGLSTPSKPRPSRAAKVEKPRASPAKKPARSRETSVAVPAQKSKSHKSIVEKLRERAVSLPQPSYKMVAYDPIPPERRLSFDEIMEISE
jgi:hypothetical protein